MTPRLGAALLLLAFGAPAFAEEFDVTVTLRGDAPVAVLFLKCSRNGEIAGTEEAPAGCKDREADRTFSAAAARITNLGSSIVWVHIGRAKLPVLPGRTYRRRLVGNAAFDRIFLSGEAGSIAHVFASNPIQDEPEEAPRESHPSRGW